MSNIQPAGNAGLENSRNHAQEGTEASQGHGHGPEGNHGNDSPHSPHPVAIVVNEKPVRMDDKDATGMMIKQAAIAQGVQIGVDFVLFHLLKNGQQRIVRDDEAIKLHQGEGFEAIRNDDNS